MTRTICVALCALAALAAAGAQPALAQLKSLEEKTTGKGEFNALTLEAGGATIECASIETTTPATWTISNGKEGVKKGEDLKISVEKWNECKAASGELKGAVTVTGCGMEVKEPSSQTKVITSINSTCTIKSALGCEITLTPEANKELKSTELAYADKEDKDLFMEGTLTGVKTKASAGCSTFGVKSSEEGKIGTFEVMEEVNPEALKPVFWLTAPRRLTAAAPMGEAEIFNETGAAAMLSAFDTTQTPAGNYLKIENEATCRTFNYPNGGSCFTKAKRDAAPSRIGKLKWRIQTMAGGVAELDTLIGV